jgi:nucleoid-associated protein YgaU
VTRGESLWSIAQDHLGDGARYPEIAALNADALGGRPAFLLPGTVLTLPATDPAGAPGEGTYTVRKGDTLSGIADKKLGDAGRYPEIFDASQNITQPGGRHLSDPDVIDIGWTLAIPEPQGSTATAPASAAATPPETETDPLPSPSRAPAPRRPHGTARPGRRPRRRTPSIVRVTSLGRA